MVRRQTEISNPSQVVADGQDKDKIKHQLYYLNNKNRFKLYYENNKDKFKEYYNNNKDKIREYNHKYWIHSHKCNYKRCIVNKQIQPPVPKISDKPIIVTFGFK